MFVKISLPKMVGKESLLRAGLMVPEYTEMENIMNASLRKDLAILGGVRYGTGTSCDTHSILYCEGKDEGEMGILQLSLQVIRCQPPDRTHGDRYTVRTLQKTNMAIFSPQCP